jgi:hypothetical protein
MLSIKNATLDSDFLETKINECQQLFAAILIGILKIYIERELGYGVLQSTKTLCALRSIFNFKSEMIDPSRSI